MTPDDLKRTRYASHLPISAIGPSGQQRIAEGRVALVGMGGLGCAAAQYLASSGLGQLTICDFDRIEISNLARQVLYTAEDVGRRKAHVAATKLASLNADLVVTALTERIDTDRASELFRQHDLVIDASDNYGTRLVSNRAALDTGTPWLMAACIRMEGQLAVFRPDMEGPCYRCAYGTAPETLEDCPGAGVFAPVAGVTGTLAALQALKMLLGLEVDNAMNLFDAERLQWRRIRITRKADCPACGARPKNPG